MKKLTKYLMSILFVALPLLSSPALAADHEMDEGGASGILTSKVKLGADASVAAGPVGRDLSAETDATLRADILSYSRARGAFAGIALEGSTIRPDGGANEQIYGQRIPAKQIVRSGRVAIKQPPRDWFRHWTPGLQTISHNVVETDH